MVFMYNANSFRAMMIHMDTHTHTPTFIQHQWRPTTLFSVRPEGLLSELNDFAKRYLPSVREILTPCLSRYSVVSYETYNV